MAWWPLRPGGARFRTLRLAVRRGRIDLETSLLHRALSWLIVLPGLSLAALVVWRFDRLDGGWAAGLLALAAFFTVAGVWYFYEVPAVHFDRARREVVLARLPLVPHRRISFDELHALQILRELVPAVPSVHSYELNLVLHDGRRVNVADHADLDDLRENARRLRAFLGIPIWDGADADAPPRPMRPIARLRVGVGLTLAGLATCALAVWMMTEMSFARGAYAAGSAGTVRWLLRVVELGLGAGLAVWAVIAGVGLIRRSAPPGERGHRGP